MPTHAPDELGGQPCISLARFRSACIVIKSRLRSPRSRTNTVPRWLLSVASALDSLTSTCAFGSYTRRANTRQELVVCVACIFTWDWLAALCAREGFACVLGHASTCRRFTGAKPKMRRSTLRRWRCCAVGACCPKRRSIPLTCGPRGICAGAGGI
jgi:hypothetical protein